jgi:hypothetical protein
VSLAHTSIEQEDWWIASGIPPGLARKLVRHNVVSLDDLRRLTKAQRQEIARHSDGKRYPARVIKRLEALVRRRA